MDTPRRSWPMRRPELVALALALTGWAAPACAPQLRPAGSLRGYTFLRAEGVPTDATSRRDAEFAALRLTPEVAFGTALSLETHLLLEFISPAGSPAAELASGRTRTWLPLEHDLSSGGDGALTARVDRLNVRLRAAGADLVVGRQAISWGVNTLWPSLDLFAPFAPTRVDRDYKPGVDAVRLTLPLGAHAEFQLIGAVLGEATPADAAGAGLLRLSAGPADLGLMLGSFHGDTVAGGFVTAAAGGTLLRGEVAWTGVGDPADRLRRPRFWRGGVGAERQLSPTLNLMVELSGNGFGESDVAAYPALLSADRLRRGEVGGLGRWHGGTTVSWQLHPLVTLTGAALLNFDDGSTAWIPRLTWSLGDESELILGALIAVGPGPRPGGAPGSEYGSQASRVLGGFRLYR